MVKALVQHIDEAHFRYGGPRKSGEPRQETWQWIGDFEEGPWPSVIEREAGRHVGLHSHGQDEIVFIMEGGFTLEGDDRFCGPGTILSLPS